MFHSATIQIIRVNQTGNEMHAALFHGKNVRLDDGYYSFFVPELKDTGILIRAPKPWKHDGVTYYMVEAKIILPMLANYGKKLSGLDVEKDTVKAIRERDMPYVIDAFKIAIESCLPFLPSDLSEWYLSRIDYTVDIDMLGSYVDFVPKYMPFDKPLPELNHYSVYVPYEDRRYYLPEVYCALLNRGRPKKYTKINNLCVGSYYYGNGSYQLNFYDKTDQIHTRQDYVTAKEYAKIYGTVERKVYKMMQDELKDYVVIVKGKKMLKADILTQEQQKQRNKYNIEDASGILRLEVQCFKGKITKTINENRIEIIDYDIDVPGSMRRDRTLLAMTRDAIAVDVVTGMLEEISQTNVPYKSHEETVRAIKRLPPKQVHEATKDKMLDVVERVNRATDPLHSMLVWSDAEVKRIAKKMIRYGINPVCLRAKEIELLGLTAKDELPALIDVYWRYMTVWNESWQFTPLDKTRIMGVPELDEDDDLPF